MRFAAEVWLFGVAFSLLLGLILVAQGLRLQRARRKFGQDERMSELLTARTGGRRAISAVLLCLAVAFAFLAAAQPQYGRGTRVLPKTNLDVVLVLDFSKSMYARDVSPSRIGRAKVEVARLVRELSGARFGAVAFAGESISFPLTSDGAAIAQFFRGLEPNDMPLGGTAIARALETGRQLLERDPLSKNHERILILITDGEDLEGDPVEVARSIRAGGMRVEVVQIGGQSPEPIPEIDENDSMVGLRRDDRGQILTTALSVEGEAQLAAVAAEGGGQVVRAATGQVGIDEMSVRLRKLMTEELSERVETVYADVFQYPLALAVMLLMLEVWIGTASRRVVQPEPALGKVRRRRLKRMEGGAVLLALLGLGCAEVDQVFERKSPLVEDAIVRLQAGEHDEATQKLIEYLETGPCEEGVIGVGDRARTYSDAAYDLALSFAAGALASTDKKPQVDPAAALAQGNIPGLTPQPAPGAVDPAAPAAAAPNPELDCALRLLAPIGPNEALPAALRARSYYLAGNLELSRAQFEAAVAFFDQAILLAPGSEDGDPVGKQIAYNRALALRLLKEEQEKKEEEQKNDEKNQSDDSEQDKSEQDPEDKKPEDESEKKEDQEQPKPDEQKPPEDQKDKPEDKQDDDKQPEQKDQQEQSKQDQPPKPDPAQEQPPQNPKQDQESARNERMLDMLEQAPTLQQHDAEQRKGQAVRGRATMEDK